MKKLFAYMLPVMLLVLLAGCPIPFASFDSGGNGAGSGDTALSADQINDSLRSLAGDFTFETLLPVQVRLEIELYDTDAEGNILPEPLPPGSADIHVSLTDTRGELLYSGKASADGTLVAAVYLPSAPEDVTLALQASGFEGRSVEIRRMVAYREINRTMAMKRLPPDQRSAARSAAGFDTPYPDSVINVPIVTVAYEDLYGRALASDADYNDFIASYSISETLDDEGRVISIKVQAEAVRKWAGYDHRFGIRIDAYGGDASVSGTYINGSGVSVSYSDQYLQAPREIVLFERSSRAVGKTAAFTITFDTPQVIDPGQAVLSRPPYNPYIYVHNTTRDIHLIDRQPLSASTNPDPADRFVDDDGYPWALLVPSDWESPAEGQRIEEAYPRFDNWRISGGSEHGDWYNYPGEPWVEPDPEPELLLVEDIRTGSSGSAPSNLMVYNGALYFSADDGVTGNELWRFDGTDATRITDLRSGAENSSPGFLTVYNASLFFEASYDGGAYTGFFEYSGTGSASRIEGVIFPGYMAVVEDVLYMRAYNEESGVELWSYDGITASPLTDINPGTGHSYPSFITGYNGSLYFQANDGTGGTELWQYSAGAASLTEEIYSGGNSFPSRLIEYNGALYFRAIDGETGYELWRNNGTIIERVTDINTDGDSVQNSNMAVYNNALYFAGTDGSNGWELYRYNGTLVEQVQDLSPGTGDGVSNSAHFIVHDGYLYFSGNDGVSGVELYRYNGIETEMIADINPAGDSNPKNFSVWNGKLYFQADDGTHGPELWEY
jgi:LruC domain-containing protein